MAGVYIHVPFCRKACHYCNFHFSTSLKLQEDFVTGILREIELRKTYLSEPVSTVYFGGGTPSILPPADIQRILLQLMRTFAVDVDAEITLEGNPDDISNEKLKQWKQVGITRLSIGVQSFFNEDLKWMNRAHDAAQAENCIHLAREAGFDNLTIDLIYGTPTLTDENWRTNVDTAVLLGITHLSCYALTVEPKTALDKLIKQKSLAGVDPEKQARHFELLMLWMKEIGFEHYEISNFAKPGYRSKHNSSYWQGHPYLGLGPSAHSFNGGGRQWNISNNALYIQSLAKGVIPYEEEILTKEQQLNEYIMTSLRTIEGLSLQKVQNDFGGQTCDTLLKAAGSFVSNNLLVIDQNSLKTTDSGKLLADGIASDLFIL